MAKSQKINRFDNAHYKKFIQEMTRIVQAKADTINQAQQMNLLFSYEESFKNLLLETERGKTLYQKFVDYIVKERGNLLLCRVFFRERQNTFNADIFPIFKANETAKLYPYRINYQFIKWILARHPRPRQEMLELVKKIEELRIRICNENLPSVIHSARTFWDKMNYSHLEYMDFVQNSAEGFMSAIDKYEPPYRKNFGSVACGRMKLFMSEDHNSTLVKIEQPKRRVLYRAKKAINKMRLTDVDKSDLGVIAKFVKESFAGENESTIEAVLSASMASNIDQKDSLGRTHLSNMASDIDVENIVEQHDIFNEVTIALKDLTILERKVLMLAFGNLDNFFAGEMV